MSDWILSKSPHSSSLPITSLSSGLIPLWCCSLQSQLPSLAVGGGPGCTSSIKKQRIQPTQNATEENNRSPCKQPFQEQIRLSAPCMQPTAVSFQVLSLLGGGKGLYIPHACTQMQPDPSSHLMATKDDEMDPAATDATYTGLGWSVLQRAQVHILGQHLIFRDYVSPNFSIPHPPTLPVNKKKGGLLGRRSCWSLHEWCRTR